MRYLSILFLGVLIGCGAAPGVEGIQGPKGDTGAQGSSGSSGSNGSNGSGGSSSTTQATIEYEVDWTQHGPQTLIACPAGFTDVGYTGNMTRNYYGSTDYNMKRTCYSQTLTCSILNLRVFLPVVTNGNPPACPAGYSEANFANFVGNFSGNYYQERTCYACH